MPSDLGQYFILATLPHNGPFGDVTILNEDGTVNPLGCTMHLYGPYDRPAPDGNGYALAMIRGTRVHKAKVLDDLRAKGFDVDTVHVQLQTILSHHEALS